MHKLNFVEMGVQKKYPACAVVIVTHNSASFLDQCMACINLQTVQPDQILIIDSGSAENDYLKRHAHQENVHFYLSKENIGYCQGNNIGFSLVQKHVKYVIFLNPDVFLPHDFIKKALDYMEKEGNGDTAVLSGLLLGYDLKQGRPSGRVDSAGIFCSWYGRWHDRLQGKKWPRKMRAKEETVPALCGALLFCRKRALETILLAPYEVMDPSFFMYKEDIDLSLRLRKEGWDLKLLPHLVAYHCRGWNKSRRSVPRQFRLMSARNEVKLNFRHRSWRLFYSIAKYCYVKWIEG